MELRPYQKEAKDAILKQWGGGVKKVLLVLPTGCGKTIVFAKVTEDCVRQGRRVLILAHRGELLEQAADKIHKATGLVCAVEKAEETCLGSWFRVVVGSVQTMMREKRLSRFAENYFDTIIIDEAHHCLSDSYQKVLSHFPGAEVLGVTATPDRGDMRDLGQFFESLAYEYEKNYIWEIADGLSLYGNEENIKQLVTILLDNAFKYSNAKGYIAISLTQSAEKKQLLIHNTGKGIDIKDQKRIFERFYRIDSSRSRQSGGYGLGLSIAESIVKNHKGQISVKSDGKSYTDFCILLP